MNRAYNDQSVSLNRKKPILNSYDYTQRLKPNHLRKTASQSSYHKQAPKPAPSIKTVSQKHQFNRVPRSSARSHSLAHHFNRSSQRFLKKRPPKKSNKKKIVRSTIFLLISCILIYSSFSIFNSVSIYDQSENQVSPPLPPQPTSPPYTGTVWFSPNIIIDTDPTAFVQLSYQGQDDRVMYDRRTSSFNTYHAHIFEAQFGSQVQVEIQVNPEFSVSDAEFEANRYAIAIGKIPAFLFRDIDTVWIYRGIEGFGGGNHNLLIHTDQGEKYILDGVLEEVFLHEATHTSIDSYHAEVPLWQAAQKADGMTISQYAWDHPVREDLAETMGPYLAVRFRADRIDQSDVAIVTVTIPNRIIYLNDLGLSMDILT